MIRDVTGDDIQIGGKWFHPMKGAMTKKEALKAAEGLRKRYGVGARVIFRERGMFCTVGKGKTRRWVPFRGYVAFRGE